MLNVKELKEMENPILITSSKGIGTKLNIALAMSKFDTVGTDLVALCANDLLSKGAKPLLFTDFISCSSKKKDVYDDILKGIDEGLKQAGISNVDNVFLQSLESLSSDNLNVSGSLLGVVDESEMITGETIKNGNSIIGITSSGLHTEGFNQVKKAMGTFNSEALNTYFDSLDATLGEELIKPSKIYTEAIKNIKEANIKIRGMANVAEGSFLQCVKDMLPDDVYAEISLSSFSHPPIFKMIQETGGFSIETMYDNFNMGIGFMVVVASQDRENAIQAIRHAGEVAFVIGSIKEGKKGIEFVD